MGRAFIIDTIAKQAAETIAELVLSPGEINIGYEDVEAIMSQQGPVLISTGRGIGNDRILRACHNALANPWKETMTKSASRVLLNITGPSNLLLQEVNDAVAMVKARIATKAEIILGVTMTSKWDDEVKIILLAGGVQT
jgi:cell division protein FtsZ